MKYCKTFYVIHLIAKTSHEYIFHESMNML